MDTLYGSINTTQAPPTQAFAKLKRLLARLE